MALVKEPAGSAIVRSCLAVPWRIFGEALVAPTHAQGSSWARVRKAAASRMPPAGIRGQRRAAANLEWSRRGRCARTGRLADGAKTVEPFADRWAPRILGWAERGRPWDGLGRREQVLGSRPRAAATPGRNL